MGAGRDEKLVRLEPDAGGVLGFDGDGVGIEERRPAPVKVHVVTREVPGDAFPFAGGDLAFAEQEVPRGDLVLEGEIDAVEFAFAEAGKVEGGLAERLGGEGAGVGRGAAEGGLLFDQRHLPAKIGRLGGAFLSGWAGSDHRQIVMFGAHKPVSPSSRPSRRRPGRSVPWR